MQTSHFFCAKFSPARAVLYFQLNQALLWSNRTAQRFNTTAGVQKLWHRMVLLNQRAVPYFLKTCGAIVSEHLRWHSFWIPAVVLNRCAVLLDHNNAQVSWKYGTVRAGLNVAHKKCEFFMFFVQNGCPTIITLLRGPNIIIWSQVHHPFKITNLDKTN